MQSISISVDADQTAEKKKLFRIPLSMENGQKMSSRNGMNINIFSL